MIVKIINKMIFVNWITITRKSAKHLRTTYRTAVSTLLGLISSVYRNLHHWRSKQRTQIAGPKLYNWANISHTTDIKSTSHRNCAAI